jgi:hypothetical protein
LTTALAEKSSPAAPLLLASSEVEKSSAAEALLLASFEKSLAVAALLLIRQQLHLLYGDDEDRGGLIYTLMRRRHGVSYLLAILVDGHLRPCQQI